MTPPALPAGSHIAFYIWHASMFCMGIGTLLPYIQIILAILLIGGVLLQQSEAGLGGAFGGDSFSSVHHTRRGFEKTLFNATILVSILFAVSVFAPIVMGQ